MTGSLNVCVSRSLFSVSKCAPTKDSLGFMLGSSCAVTKILNKCERNWPSCTNMSGSLGGAGAGATGAAGATPFAAAAPGAALSTAASAARAGGGGGDAARVQSVSAGQPLTVRPPQQSKSADAELAAG